MARNDGTGDRQRRIRVDADWAVVCGALTLTWLTLLAAGLWQAIAWASA